MYIRALSCFLTYFYVASKATPRLALHWHALQVIIKNAFWPRH